MFEFGKKLYDLFFFIIFFSLKENVETVISAFNAISLDSRLLLFSIFSDHLHHTLYQVRYEIDVYIRMLKKTNNGNVRSCMFSRYNSFFYALHGLEKHRWIMSDRPDLWGCHGHTYVHVCMILLLYVWVYLGKNIHLIYLWN